MEPQTYSQLLSSSPELCTDPDLSSSTLPAKEGKGWEGDDGEVLLLPSHSTPTTEIHCPPPFTDLFSSFPTAPPHVHSPNTHSFVGIRGALHITLGHSMEGEGPPAPMARPKACGDPGTSG